MAEPLVGDDGVDSYQDTGLLDEPEVMVDRCAEDSHLRRERHVGIHQRGDVVAEGTHGGVQRTIVGREVLRGEEGADLLLVHLYREWFGRGD